MISFLRKPAEKVIDFCSETPDAQIWLADDLRVYAIGDIHGRNDLLADLLLRICADHDAMGGGREMRLVFLGDYIDRGDGSRQVLDLLMRLSERANTHAVFLKGNHEAALEAFLEDPETGRDWLLHGGLQTLASYGVAPPRAGRDIAATSADLGVAMGAHRTFLASMPVLHREGNVVFSHAGFDPSRPLDGQASRDLLWGHPQFLDSGPPPGLVAVHGHWVTNAPVRIGRRIGIDTGAYFTGRLSAVRLDDQISFLSS